MQAALDQLKTQGEKLKVKHIARLSPLSHGHVNIPGHYTFTLAEQVTKGYLKSLKQASEQKGIA